MPKQTIQYPLLRFSLTRWNNASVEEIFREDDAYIESSHRWDDQRTGFFERELLGHDFVDCMGKVYQLTGKKTLPKTLWQRLTQTSKSQLLFTPTARTLGFSELKNYMQKGIEQLDGEQAKQMWLAKLARASNIRELLQGE